MKTSGSTGGGQDVGDAADWFVRVDAEGACGTGPAELSSWLEQPANERALERVELAVELGRRLAADPDSALYAEAARAPGSVSRRQVLGRGLKWGSALAASLLVVVLAVPDRAPPATPVTLPMRAAQLVVVDAPSNPVAVLPGGVVVDASTVAVLPFAGTGAGGGTLATGLERELVLALRAVPGLYVIADAAVSSYAQTDLNPAELGSQLGARGLVDATVELVDGRVHVSARLRAATTGATLWQTEVDRPVDELRAVRHEIAEQVAVTMLDSSLRVPVARADGSTATFAAGKPFQQ